MAVTNKGWQVTPHVCRSCFGRILVKPIKQTKGTLAPGYHDLFAEVDADNSDSAPEQHRYQVRCADCDASTQGETTALCACGSPLKNNNDAGLRCQPHPRHQPGEPEVVAVYGSVGAR